MLDFLGFEIKSSVTCCPPEEGSRTSCPKPVLFKKKKTIIIPKIMFKICGDI
jgi:hypothetical protein